MCCLLVLVISASAWLKRSMSSVGVERPGTDAHGPVGKGAEGTVDIRSAVQARPDGDVERLIENAAQFGGRQRLAAETERADPLRHIAMAEHFEAADFVQAAPESFQQLDFVTVNLGQALLLRRI